MLSQLSVKNLAVVDKLDLSLGPGMSSITGETGSGKSILVQALSFALGSRGDSSIVRSGKEKAEVSAIFEAEKNNKVQSYLKKNELDENGECVLRRVIGSDGRSKAFVNGSGVALSTIRKLGSLLIDMHGQNEHQLLLRQDQQLNLLDGYAKLEKKVSELNLVVSRHIAVTKNIENLTNNQNKELQQKEVLIHHLAELDEAALEQVELDSVESDFKVSVNAKSIIEKIANMLHQIDSEGGTNEQLLNLSNEISKGAEIDPLLSDTADLLLSSQLQLQECAYNLNSYLSSLSVDEQRTKYLEERLSELHRLSRKHNCDITELLKIRKSIIDRLSEVESSGDDIKKLIEQKSKYESDYRTKAKQIKKIRIDSATIFSSLVTNTMQELGMPGSEFKATLTDKKESINLNGSESVEFLVKINTGQKLMPLNKVASGGELSRVSLAISVVTADSEYAPTLIFDEVDVGISGAIAEVVGSKLKEISQHYQVICITHLAQVASFGHQHLRVTKLQQKDCGAQVRVEELSKEDRVQEVARILGGLTITDKARKTAAEMIKKSA
jgi:DNA repair protein RecN (Recombination protein N)